MKLTTTDSNNQKIALSNEAILELNLSLKETILTFLKEIGFELYSIQINTRIYKNPNISNIFLHLDIEKENEINIAFFHNLLKVSNVRYENKTAKIKVYNILEEDQFSQYFHFTTYSNLEEAFNFTLSYIRHIWTKNETNYSR